MLDPSVFLPFQFGLDVGAVIALVLSALGLVWNSRAMARRKRAVQLRDELRHTVVETLSAAHRRILDVLQRNSDTLESLIQLNALETLGAEQKMRSEQMRARHAETEALFADDEEMRLLAEDAHEHDTRMERLGRRLSQLSNDALDDIRAAQHDMRAFAPQTQACWRALRLEVTTCAPFIRAIDDGGEGQLWTLLDTELQDLRHVWENYEGINWCFENFCAAATACIDQSATGVDDVQNALTRPDTYVQKACLAILVSKEWEERLTSDEDEPEITDTDVDQTLRLAARHMAQDPVGFLWYVVKLQKAYSQGVARSLEQMPLAFHAAIESLLDKNETPLASERLARLKAAQSKAA
ncbi:hypothetical protein [Tropicibacter naphthalenivorans]|uniref:Uncharacterized protein n=1 Tax=Tropicibacter naphthalenivorans TaxID=441103 RepID=A0A0P1G3R7_9RHOB|nr:hypothetical protein [Tropicibacter naphthalenivorans]CUH76464.1 hypothetical protein TRN7648_00948 [Tropicibacter naphthalenivorans]SMC65985.1 hypothetical protein SAMN04488093_102670 [Tropicibacter naphthalenivorans]